MDLPTFLERFHDQTACLTHLEAVRWPKGPVCPKCGTVDVALRLQREGYWHCHACRAQFSVTNGTPMEGTHLPLRTWFGAIFLMATSSNGISAMVLSRQLDLGYKTAWFQSREKLELYRLKDCGIAHLARAGVLVCVGTHGRLAPWKGHGYSFHSTLHPIPLPEAIVAIPRLRKQFTLLAKNMSTPGEGNC